MVSAVETGDSGLGLGHEFPKSFGSAVRAGTTAMGAGFGNSNAGRREAGLSSGEEGWLFWLRLRLLEKLIMAFFLSGLPDICENGLIVSFRMGDNAAG